jgi:hypothetical protein
MSRREISQKKGKRSLAQVFRAANDAKQVSFYSKNPNLSPDTGSPSPRVAIPDDPDNIDI